MNGGAVDRVVIIGVPPNGGAELPARLHERMAEADILCGGSRLLELFPGVGKERWPIESPIEAFVQKLKAVQGKRVVVLASGDPLLFGIGTTLVRELGADRVEIVPAVSAVQEAFARCRVPWDDARVVSAHGRPLEPVVAAARYSPKVAIYTDAVNTPGRIAGALLASGSPDRRVVVAEQLGQRGERVEETTLEAVQNRSYASLNVMLVLGPITHGISTGNEPVTLEDTSLDTQKGQFTRQEVRALCLGRLGGWPCGVMWDIGAGSGAMSIEYAKHYPLVQLFAVERDPDQEAVLRTNLARFHISSVAVIRGEAPEVLEDLPDPHAIFVGGTGGRLVQVLEVCWGRLRPNGRLVVNLVVLRHLTDLLQWCVERDLVPDLLHAQISRGVPIVGSQRFDPLHPVYIASLTR